MGKVSEVTVYILDGNALKQQEREMRKLAQRMHICCAILFGMGLALWRHSKEQDEAE